MSCVSGALQVLAEKCKTTYLARQVNLAAQKYGSEGVMVCSFTKAAAAEIVGRDLALAPDRVGTLHAFCYRALGRPPIAEDPKMLKKWAEAYPHYAFGSEGDFDDAAVEMPGADDGDRVHSQVEVLRQRMFPRKLWPEEAEAFYKAWCDFKKQEGALDFTDLIVLALREIEVAPLDPRVLLVDECQDLSKIELTLVRKWGAKAESLVLAGDPLQCLYSFKGAEPRALVNPPIPESQKRILSQSYRVPRAVHAVAERWIKQSSSYMPEGYRPRDADGAVIRDDSLVFRDPEYLIRMIEPYLEQGKTVMILASCAYMLDGVCGALKQAGMPFSNKWRPKQGRWNPLGTREGAAYRRLLAYLRNDSGVFGERARLWSYDDVKAWADPLRAEGLFRRGAKEAIKGSAGGLEVDIAWLQSLFEEGQLAQAFGMDLDWFEGRLLDSKKALFQFPLNIARQRGAQVLLKPPLCSVGTIHSTKGAEADCVLVSPDLSPVAYESWGDSGEARDAIVRMFYVAQTRARETLVLCGSSTSAGVEWV